jgi:hypothetical protein
MGESEHPQQHRRTAPDGIVHAVRLHLHRLLAETPTPFPCQYGCFIHPRRRRGERGFGVITPSGESLPLTVAMLQAWERVPTLLEGRTVAVVSAVDAEDALIPAGDEGSWAVPLPVTRIAIRLGTSASVAEARKGPQQILTPSMEGPQLTFLCAERPEGWPV